MATYYVDGNANNDSGDGSSNRPWKTLSKAADQTNPNDEVRVRSATYREAVSYTHLDVYKRQGQGLYLWERS